MASHGIPRYQQDGAKSEQVKAKHSRLIQDYKSLVQQVADAMTRNVLTHETLTLTSELLTWNPEFYTVWNHRRHVIQQILASRQHQGDLDQETEARKILVSDMQFLLPLLMKYPKCYWIWNHRRWLLLQSSNCLVSEDAKAIWAQELGLVGKMLARDSRNFHGWGYRRFVVGELQQFAQQDYQNKNSQGSDINPPTQSSLQQSLPLALGLTETEFDYTTKMINTNLSNFSAWHNRSKLIPKLLEERQADIHVRREMFDDELSLIRSALFTDPYDQSLWFYHEFLMTVLCSVDHASFATFTILDRREYLEKEISEIRNLLEDTTDCKLIYQHLLQYSNWYLEIEAGKGNETILKAEMHLWLEELIHLDPLRQGRWKDLAMRLNLE